MKNKKQKQNNSVDSNQIIIDQKITVDAIVKAYQISEKQKVEKEIELEKNQKQEFIVGTRARYYHQWTIC